MTLNKGKDALNRIPNRAAALVFVLAVVLMPGAVSLLAQTTVTFTSSGSWTVPAGVNSVSLLVVGGGGGGGSVYGGGGGGGQVVYNPSYGVTPLNPITITVGTGGGAGINWASGAAGGNSAFGGVTALGGGGGGGYSLNGGAGANGGGGGGAGGLAGAGSPGYNGAPGNTTAYVSGGGCGGGGGGSGGAGSVGNGSNAAGPGGPGTLVNGSYYGGGGGAGIAYASSTPNQGAAGGSGGGGSGGGNQNGSNGTPGTGGGGGGGGWLSPTAYNGGNGGSGVVVITYTAPPAITSVTINTATYTGSALTPTYTTTPAGGSVSFSPATETNAGTYTLNWTATGSYIGSGTASWTINRASLASATIQSLTFNGLSQQPNAVSSVTPAGAPVTVSSSASHSAAGTYTDGIVSLASSANYNAGTLSGLSWVINAIPITAATIQSVANNGQAQYPTSVSSVTPSSATVTVSSSSSHTAAGTYNDGVVTGTGNYSGTISGLTWTITPQTQAAVAISPTSTSVLLGQSTTLTASGGSGTGAYSFTNNGNVVSSSTTSTTDTVTFGNTGSSSVNVYKAGDSNFSQSNTASASVTIGKATPVGSLASQASLISTQAITSQMLNAVFTNPYSSAVVQPTGTVQYSATPGYPTLTAGTVLPLGQYTVTASYPGDSNYNPATTTATFTVLNKLGTSTYGYQGASQYTYTVPSLTDYVVIKAWGAGGGEGVLTPGGAGAFVTAQANMSVGQTLSVTVGGAGNGYSSGGWPGGGTAAGLGGAGGGGYSRASGSGVDLWAGAGGGGGNGASYNGVGGIGGGPNGGAGGGPGGTGGGGGTQGTGGSGGSGNTASGSMGSAGAGGNSNNNSNYVGGGGGAGYFGGGGGGTGTYGNGGGGGGGGSSYVNSGGLYPAYAGGSGSTPAGTSDPDYPQSSGVAYGGNGGTYTSGGNGYVVISAYQKPKAPVFVNVPSQSNPQTFANLQVISYPIQANAAPAITLYGIASGSSLPPGYSLNPTTGVISGQCTTAPTSNMSYSTQITATNSVGTTTATYYWTILAPVMNYVVANFDNNAPKPGNTVTFSYTVTANFGVAWTESELWPPGNGSPSNLQNDYSSGNPTTFSGSKTIIVPPQPGIYTFQLRVADPYYNYTDFWFIFVVGEGTNALPYTTSFEASEAPAWSLGQLTVENKWMAWQGGAYVVTSASGTTPYDGSNCLQLLGSTQYALLDGGIPILVELVKGFNVLGGAYNGAYIDLYAQPLAAASYLNSSIINYGDSEVGFQILTTPANSATVMVLNGNGTGGGTWTDTGIHFAIDSTGKATSWQRFTVYHYYANHTWSLWVNSAFYGPNSLAPASFWMINNTTTSLNNVTWLGSTNTSYMDKLSVQTTTPFPTPVAPVIASASASSNSITINWNPPSPADPYGILAYQVEYSVGSGSPTIVGTTSGRTMTIPSLSAGTSYSFYVQAENVSGNWSPWSSAYSTTLTSVVEAAGAHVTFTYNGHSQGPPLNSATFTLSPASATYTTSGTTAAVNAGSYSFTITPSGSFIGPPLTISWTINPFLPTISVTAPTYSTSVNGSITFTASGGGTTGYTWTVSPNTVNGLSGSSATQTVTFPTVPLKGTPPSPGTYTITAYSNADPINGNPPNYLQSLPVSVQVSVSATTTTDNTNSSEQINVHAPTQ